MPLEPVLLIVVEQRRSVSPLETVTHVFYSAYAPAAKPADEIAPNLAMLVNVVSCIERASPELRHVTVMQGSKWYGNHLGPYRTPAREDDPLQSHFALAGVEEIDREDPCAIRPDGPAARQSDDGPVVGRTQMVD